MSNGQVPISAVRFGSFRTLRDVEFRATGQITVVCGPNNSGKSSLLDALEAYSGVHNFMAGDKKRSNEQDNSPAVIDLMAGGLAIGLDLTHPALAEVLAGHVQEHQKADIAGLPSALRQQLDAEDGVWWVQLSHQGNHSPRIIADENPARTLRQLVKRWQSGGGAERTWVRAMHGLSAPNNSITANWFARAFEAVLTPVDLRRIADVRRLGPSPLDGDQLDLLVRASARAGVHREMRTKWARELEGVLRDVFGQDVHYEASPAPTSGNELRLTIDGQTDIPIENLGAGVREVVAVAFAALSSAGPTVLCIEEPENCLHPTAARRLIQSLARRTKVQLIVSTHSAAVVNADPHTVINVERTGATSTCRTVANARERFRAVTQLGHSPSDLVLAHCAVWVEGPSDRLYLKAWLANHGLEEGVDYSMMFYGGALGANVGISSDPNDGNLYAEIRPLCRRTAIVADSDQDKRGARRKPHVRRWEKEAENDTDALVLTTPFREVENCLPLDVANQCLTARRGQPIKQADYRYARVIQDSNKMPKVAFAQQAVANGGDVPGDHALGMVEQLAQFIRQSRLT